MTRPPVEVQTTCVASRGDEPPTPIFYHAPTPGSRPGVDNGWYNARSPTSRYLAGPTTSENAAVDDADKSWEDDWRWIVFIDLPTGQASWHIHDSHLPMFDHVPRFAGRKWDGHTTEEKYARISLLHTPPSGGGGA